MLPESLADPTAAPTADPTVPPDRSPPALSIGMPVYNAARFLPKALDSILGQTFTDFELIVSDNCSTDVTEAICRGYAARDGRMRYSRNERNLGAGPNFRKVYDLARGRYYKQAAHDDFCEPTYVEKAIGALEADPALTVAYARTRVVDAEGAFLHDYDVTARVADPDPLVRWRDLVLHKHQCYQIFGIHRMSALRRIPPMGSFANADGILLAQLALLGPFYEIPERLSISTKHAHQASWTMPARLTSKGRRLTRTHGTLPNMEWWDLSRAQKIGFPEWHILARYWESVGASPLSAAQKLRAYRVVLAWAAKYRRPIIGDLVRAADQLLWRFQSRLKRKTEAARAAQTQGGNPA